jgi:hypothetical protein
MMLAAALLAVTVTNSAVEREALASRWMHAARASIPAERRLREGTSPAPSTLASLPALTRVELGVPGRYQLATETRPPNPTWWQRFVGWVRYWWNAFWHALFGRIRFSAKATAAIGDAIVAALVLAVVTLALRLIALYGGRRSAATVRALPEAPDARTLYAKAAVRAEKGEFAAAARLLFRATLTVLDGRGAVSDDLSATVGEIRRRLRERERDAIAPFDEVASAFVAATYAERPLDAAQWERARSAYLTLADEATA